MPPVFTPGQPLQLHESYKARKQARNFWRRAYWSGPNFAAGKDAIGSQLLPKHERETEDRYTRRLTQAIVRRYPRYIIDRYNDHANRVPAERPESTGPYGQLLADATGSGLSLPRLMRKAMRMAQIQAEAYLLADFNMAGVFLTAADEAAAGKRGIIQLVKPDQVVWWSDWHGQVDSAVITFCDREGKDFAWYVTATTQQRVQLERKENELKVVGADDEQKHNFKGCPLVRLVPEWDDEVDGGDDSLDSFDSQVAPLAESQKRILNIDSWLLEELQGSTFTTPVFLGVDPDQMANAVVGVGKGLAIPGGAGGTPSLDKLGADPAQAESLRVSLDREVKELYRAAGLSSGNPTETAQPESGVAKAFAFNEVEARLSALADAAEDAENLVVKRLSSGSGWSYPGDANWPDSFATPDLVEDLEFTIRTITAPLPQVIKDQQVKTYAAEAYKFTPDQNAALETQMAAQQQQVQDDAENPFVNPPKQTDTAPVPATTGQPASDAGKVQDTALNGAQVTALQGIIQSVASGQLPALAAELMIIAAFPDMDEAEVKKMVASADKFTPETPAKEQHAAPPFPPAK